MNNKVRGLHINYWVGAICMIFLTTCVGANQDNVAQLEGKTWTLTAYDNRQPITGHQPTILFEDGEISGSTGCNHYGGTYRSEDDTIQFEGIFSTEMACLDPAELMEQERLYLQALAMVSRYELENEKLTFFSGSNFVLTFEIHVSTAAELMLEPTDFPPEPTDPPPTVTIPAPTTLPMVEPPTGFKVYEEEEVGVLIYIPETWEVSTVVAGEYAIFQSYPVDKYVGGEPREPDDSKCDLKFMPKDTQPDDFIQEWEANPSTTIVSRDEVILHSGLVGQRIVLEDLGRSVALVTEIDNRAVMLICFGNPAPFDEIAMTLGRIE